jgi:hypothetical protein
MAGLGLVGLVHCGLGYGSWVVMSCGGTRLGLSIGACGGPAGGLAHLGNFGVLAYDFSSLGVYAYCLGLGRWVLGCCGRAE